MWFSLCESLWSRSLCASTTDHFEKVEMIQLVRVTVEQIVVCQYHRSCRKVEVIPLVRTVEQIVANQCHRSCTKCGGGSACAFRCGTDRGQPVPQIMGITGRWSAFLADFTSILVIFCGTCVRHRCRGCRYHPGVELPGWSGTCKLVVRLASAFFVNIDIT